MFTLEKEMAVPASRHLHFDFDLPESWSGQEVRVVLSPMCEKEDGNDDPLLKMFGSCKGKDTMEAYFARHHADNQAD